MNNKIWIKKLKKDRYLKPNTEPMAYMNLTFKYIESLRLKNLVEQCASLYYLKNHPKKHR